MKNLNHVTKICIVCYVVTFVFFIPHCLLYMACTNYGEGYVPRFSATEEWVVYGVVALLTAYPLFRYADKIFAFFDRYTVASVLLTTIFVMLSFIISAYDFAEHYFLRFAFRLLITWIAEFSFCLLLKKGFFEVLKFLVVIVGGGSLLFGGMVMMAFLFVGCFFGLLAL